MKPFSKNLSRSSSILFSVALLIAASGAWTDSFAQTRSIPHGTQMKIRLENEIDSRQAQNGDRFTATVDRKSVV